jgi:hypothetical protein
MRQKMAKSAKLANRKSPKEREEQATQLLSHRNRDNRSSGTRQCDPEEQINKKKKRMTNCGSNRK